MFVCQWSLVIVFGKLSEAMQVIKQWGEEKFRSSGFKKSKNSRVITGYIGESASLVIDEYTFESLNDFEKALGDMSQPQFQEFSKRLAPLVVPGSQKWTVFRIVK